MTNIKKSRKEHDCDFCGNKIPIGSPYLLIEQIEPTYGNGRILEGCELRKENDKQTGILFIKTKACNCPKS
jgi:hypothetical protein